MLKSVTTLFGLVFLFLCISQGLYAEVPVSLASYKSALLKFEEQSQGWDKLLRSVDMSEIPVSYGEGKMVDMDNQVAQENLALLVALSVRIRTEDHLSDEINFLATLGDFNAYLQALGAQLLDTTAKDEKSVDKVSAWAKAVTDIAHKSGHQLYLVAFHFTTARADELEYRQCSTNHKK